MPTAQNTAPPPEHTPEHTVAQGRAVYLDENGFTLAAYEDNWTKASLLGFRFAMPNTASHRRAIKLHDLHHVATGFGTDPAGEGEISAWELRRGLRGLGLYVGGLVLAGTAMGLLVAPKRTVRAWKLSARGHTSLFTDGLAYNALLELSIGELRERLGIPPEGLAIERGLHSTAPSSPAATAHVGSTDAPEG